VVPLSYENLKLYKTEENTNNTKKNNTGPKKRNLLAFNAFGNYFLRSGYSTTL